MIELLQFRERYGDVYVLILPSGQKIPCQPLSVGDYLKYDSLFREGRIPSSYLENEIFQKCVLDKSFTGQINHLRAGIVTTVASLVMQISAPTDLAGIDQALAISRHKANATLHDLVAYVCQAFPAYKPEDLYDMPFDTFMLRVGMAERKLLNTGITHEPLSLIDYSKQKQGPAKSRIKQPQQQDPRKPPMPPPPDANLAKMWEESRTTNKTIIRTADIVEHHAAYTGHEKEDRILNEHKMVEETASLYPEYMEQIKAGQKVSIKSPEERKAAALLRAEKSKQELKEMIARQKKADQDLTDRLAKQRKAKRTAKKR